MANVTQMSSGNQPTDFINTELVNVGVSVIRVTTPAPSNGLAYWTNLPSVKLADTTIELKELSTFGTSAFNRLTFQLRVTNINGISAAGVNYLDFYINLDGVAGTPNFTCRLLSPAPNEHQLIIIDSTGDDEVVGGDPLGLSPDDTNFQCDVLYQIHATAGVVAFYVDGQLEGARTSMNTKVATAATAIHQHKGHSNVLEVPPACGLFVGGWKHDSEVLVPSETLGWARVAPDGYKGVAAPVMEDQAGPPGTQTIPGQDLDIAAVEDMSDDTHATTCTYNPGAGVNYGGAFPCDRSSRQGPNSLFNADSIVHGVNFIWWYIMAARGGNALDLGFTYGKYDGTTFSLTTTNGDGVIGLNKVQKITLFDGDTDYPNVLTDWAVIGWYNGVALSGRNPNPMSLRQAWIDYCFDWDTRAQATVHVKGLAHIEGLASIL